MKRTAASVSASLWTSVWTGLGLVALAAGVRLAHLLAIHDSVLFDVPVGDARAYDEWAREIAAGSWHSGEVFYQAPLYPYLLAAVYALLGEGPWAPRLVQIGLGSLSCLLLALAGRRFLGARAGWLAGVLLALYAPAVYYDGLLQKTSLALFLGTALLFLLGEYARRPRWGCALGAGVLLGAFALTRENSLILVPLALLWTVCLAGDCARPWRPAGALLLGVALLLALVGFRNQAIGGRFLITTFNAGPNFYIGNNPTANGTYQPLRKGRGSPAFERDDARALAERALGRALDPAEVSSYWLAKGLTFVREQPADWLRLLARKWLLVWHTRELVDTDSIEAYRDASPLLDVLARVLHFGVVAPLAVLGLWATRRRWRRLWVLYGIVLLSASSVAAFFVLARYRVTMIPALLLFAAAGLLELGSALRERRPSALGAGALLAVVAAVASNWPLREPHDPRATTLYAVGNRLREQGRPADARRVLEQVVEHAPDFSDARIALGHSLMDAGRSDEAIERFREALLLNRMNADAHSGLGAALIARGAREAGVAELRRATEIEPAHSDAHNHLGNALLRDGHPREALGHYEQALLERPHNIDILSNVAVAHASMGRLERALAEFDALLEVAPAHPLTLANRALVLEALGRTEEALTGYRRALDVAPVSDPEARRVASDGMRRLTAQQPVPPTHTFTP